MTSEGPEEQQPTEDARKGSSRGRYFVLALFGAWAGITVARLAINASSVGPEIGDIYISQELAEGRFAADGSQLSTSEGRRWYKGNFHTHSLWSDGDAAPEHVVERYRSAGYDFLCITPHNGAMDGDKWVKISKKGPLTPAHVGDLKEGFGEKAVETREGLLSDGMRLKTFEELKIQFDRAGEFLLIRGQEITARSRVHVNVINLSEEIKEGGSLNGAAETILFGVDAARDQSQRYGVPVIAQVNHPNLDFGNRKAYVAARHLAIIPDARFFEVYSGFATARNAGDSEEGIDSTETLWDKVLTLRAAESPRLPLYGLANDDAHQYYEEGPDVSAREVSVPGRGWNMVLASELSAVSVLEAMERGDFYASTGVDLESIGWNKEEFRISIKAAPGVEYVTQFVGTLAQAGGKDSARPTRADVTDAIKRDEALSYSEEVGPEIGVVLYETKSNPAVYRFTGKELYVRARVTSTKLQKNSQSPGDSERCWTQPVFIE